MNSSSITCTQVGISLLVHSGQPQFQALNTFAAHYRLYCLLYIECQSESLEAVYNIPSILTFRKYQDIQNFPPLLQWLEYRIHNYLRFNVGYSAVRDLQANVL